MTPGIARGGPISGTVSIMLGLTLLINPLTGINGWLRGQARVRVVGAYFVAIGLGFFIMLAALFEVGVFRSSLAARIGWPLLLIAAGLALTIGSLTHTLIRRERDMFAEFTP